MKASKTYKAKGMFHKVNGKVKEIAGDLTDNPKLEAEGINERIIGTAQVKVGQIKKVLDQ